MKIEPIGHPQNLQRTTDVDRQTRQARRATFIQPLTAADIVPAPHVSAAAEPLTPVAIGESVNTRVGPVFTEEPKQHDRGRASGAMRQLEAGHFKGVADVRLRINFFEELSARAGTAGQAAAVEASMALIDTVARNADQLLQPFASDQGPQETLTGMIDEFGRAVRDAVDQTAAGGGFDADSVAGSIQEAFGAFVIQVGALLGSPTGEPDLPADSDVDPDAVNSSSRPTGTTLDVKGGSGEVVSISQAIPFIASAVDVVGRSVTDPIVEPTLSLDEAVTKLVDSFDEALANLRDLTDVAGALADPSVPSGNGVAYQKFIAIYDVLRGVSSDVDQVV